jgi:hypothetical protein
MTHISNSLLNDTLTLAALARETALARGSQAQAQKLDPVVQGLRRLVVAAQSPEAGPPPPPETGPALPPAGGLLASNDFQTLLAARAGAGSGLPADAAADRLQAARAMLSGGMAEVDIARSLGITREEVQMLASVTRPANAHRDSRTTQSEPRNTERVVRSV